jgi:hypothetical protein
VSAGSLPFALRAHPPSRRSSRSLPQCMASVIALRQGR